MKPARSGDNVPLRLIDLTSAMQAGLGLLRLPPAHFWSMTPRELAYALSCCASQPIDPGMLRSDLDVLLQSYPDDYPTADETEVPVSLQVKT